MTQDPSSPSRKPLLIVVGGIAGLAVVAWLAFGFFGIQAAFTDQTVDEEIVFADDAAAADSEPDDAEPSGAEPDEAPTESAPAEDEVQDDQPAADDSPEPAITEIVEGVFEARDHPAEGRAVVVTNGAERLLAFEDFATDNGPDLNVYLFPAGDYGDDYLDLGDLKGNKGNQNYPLPADADLDHYNRVVIWCVRFGVPFGEAALG